MRRAGEAALPAHDRRCGSGVRPGSATPRALLLALVGLAACDTTPPPPPASQADILQAQGAGQAFLQQDNLAEAGREFARLVEMAPDESAGYAGLGLVALRDGDFDEAERRLVAARERSPEDAELPLALARIEMERGDPEAALAILREALAVDSTHARTLWALAEFERDGGRPASDDRRDWLRRVLDVAPGNLATHVELVDAELAREGVDGARRAMELLRQIAPDFPSGSRALFDAAEEALFAEDPTRAAERFAEFREVFEVTAPYQEALSTVRPPAGQLVGVPQLFLSFMTGSLRVQEQEAVLAALNYAEASELAGFEDLPSQPPGAEPGSAALAVGD
ncbi:MAG: tetratricopeptide repeat protein, partial [Gemmatimonadetes bacterium]|nr:tetratricopeptide repeat protein [Gemmatimonadota bacterium]